MKTASVRNWRGPLGVGLVIAALAVVGCTMHGGGVVALFTVSTGLGAGVPTDANVAVSVNCNGNTNEVRSIIHWTDNTNGANFTARLPSTPISELFPVATCEEAAAIVSDTGTSLSVGVINSRGQESGDVLIAVSAPGEGAIECGDLQSVGIEATGSEDVLPGGFYSATGCLDHGKISFGRTP